MTQVYAFPATIMCAGRNEIIARGNAQVAQYLFGEAVRRAWTSPYAGEAQVSLIVDPSSPSTVHPQLIRRSYDRGTIEAAFGSDLGIRLMNSFSNRLNP